MFVVIALSCLSRLLQDSSLWSWWWDSSSHVLVESGCGQREDVPQYSSPATKVQLNGKSINRSIVVQDQSQFHLGKYDVTSSTQLTLQHLQQFHKSLHVQHTWIELCLFSNIDCLCCSDDDILTHEKVEAFARALGNVSWKFGMQWMIHELLLLFQK